MLRAVTGSTDAEGMREKVREKVEESLQTANGFKLRVVSLNDALCAYFESGTITADNVELRSLQKDISSLLGHTEQLLYMSNKDRNTPERQKLDERIVEACTMKVNEEVGGLLLWLGEGDMQWLADDLGLNIRCWTTEWVVIEGSESYVDQVKLVWTVSPTRSSFHDSIETQACVDIAFTECHYEQLEFVQPRFRRLRLDPSSLKKSLGKQERASLPDMQAELAKLEGNDPASRKSFAPVTRTEAAGETRAGIDDDPMAVGAPQDAGGLKWKPRGEGDSGSRLSSGFASGSSTAQNRGTAWATAAASVSGLKRSDRKRRKHNPGSNTGST